MRNQCLVGVRSPVLTVAVSVFAIAFSFDTLARAPFLATLFEAWLGLWYAPVRLLASAIQVFCVVALTSWIVRRTYLPGVADGLAPAEVDRQWVPSYVDGIAEHLRRARLFGTPVSVVLGRLGYGATWLVVWGSIAWLFAWTASGGTYRFQSASVPYYDLLADAFLAGQFHLLITPRPELLALANPYDPVLNGPLRLPDASLYNGKYYLYFGPVPGLIHAGWKLLTGWRLEEGTMLLAASLIGCLFFWLLARRVRALAFPDLPEIWVRAVTACYVFGGVGLLLAARSIGHHEALAVASAFVLSGLYLWLRGLEGGQWTTGHFVVGGLLLGCAFGSRQTLISFPLACGLVMVWRWLQMPRDRRLLGQMAAFGFLPGVAVLLHLTYNLARFGSPFDFGMNYQLTGLAGLDTESNAFGVVSFNNVERNLHTYFVRLPEFIPYFPFHLSFPGGVPGWLVEAPLLPVPLVAPLALLAPLSIALMYRHLWRPSESIQWFIIGTAAGLAIPAAVTVFQVAATARYLQDTLPAATMLGGIGLWWLRSATSAVALGRQVVRFASVGLVALSTFMGVTLGMSELSYDKPEAYSALAYRVDRAVGLVSSVVAPTAWYSQYTQAVRRRPNGPFYTDSLPYDLQVAPGTVVQSLSIASGFPEPTRLQLRLNGRQVLDERVFPGTQALLLDERIDIGSAETVSIELRLPDRPSLSSGSLLPVSIFSPSSRPAYTISRSHRTMLEQLRRNVEQGQRNVEDAQRKANAARADLDRFLARQPGGQVEGTAVREGEILRQRLAEAELFFTATMEKLRRDDELFRAEHEYLATKEAQVAAAARR